MPSAGKKTRQELLQENEDLRAQLAEAQETLRAIHEGEVDAIVVTGGKGEQVFSLVGADSVYRLIVETMKEAAFTVTFDGRILFCNAQFGEFVRRPPEQIVGHSLHEFVASENRENVDSLLISAKVQPVKQRLVFRDAEGALVPAHVSANVINQPDELSICIVASNLSELENSTVMIQQLRSQQLALRESEARYRLLFESNLDAIFLAMPDGKIIAANPAACAMFGWSEEELCQVGRDLIIDPSDPRLRKGLDEHARTGKFRGELPMTRKDGTKFAAEVSTVILQDEEQRVFVIVSDITERKRAEEALRRSEQDYRTLADSERAARSEAEQVNRMKDEFLANLSHELRGPLTPIQGWVQILRKSNLDAKTFRQGLEVIERSARTQTQLISDLLDMSRIVSGKLRLDVQSCDLPAVLEAAIDSEATSAQAKSIRVEKVIDSFGPILGDPARLQQAFWNILSNAIKFTHSRGKVQILARRINSYVEVRISDTGQGIKPEFLPYVFDRFRQADSSASKKQGGLGLGLAIVKHLVELHGGTVKVESPGEGQGATFIVTLPIMSIRAPASERPEPAETASARTADSINLTGIRVLIVDDESDTRHVITRLLEERGVVVLEAASAMEALAILQEHSIDVLIGDIGMPGVDGYEMMRRIRALPASAGGEVPAVALTAFSRMEDRNRSLLAGYQYHLAKPAEFAELAVTLAMITKRVPRS